MKKYSYILFVLTVGFLSSCTGEGKSLKTDNSEQEDSSLVEITQEQFSSMKMEISALQEREFDNTVKASGRIDVPPKSRAKVTSFIGGYVKSVSLQVGNKVTKGQPLLTLESPEYIDLQQSYLEIAGQMGIRKTKDPF